MKNFELYKEPKEARRRFADFCGGRQCAQCKYYDAIGVASCIVKWLYGEVELKPCPFCGGKAELSADEHSAMVQCNDCECGTPLTCDAAQMVELWNKRVQAPALKKEGGPKPVSEGGAR